MAGGLAVRHERRRYAAGGQSPQPARDEVVWNDLHWLTSANGGGAGGGGVAFGYARPPYQRHIHVSGDRRATPDMAVHASMLPGYPIIANGQWILDGGTSAAAPLAAAAFSTISARLHATGEPPIGPVNGLVYWLERHNPSALYDVISGNNRYDRHAPATAHTAVMTSQLGWEYHGLTVSPAWCPDQGTDRVAGRPEESADAESPRMGSAGRIRGVHGSGSP